MKRPLPLPATLALLLLAACSGSDGTAETTGAPPAAEPERSPVATPPDVAGPPSDATTTDSGLAYRVLTAGSGAEHPGPTDKVTVHYSGWATDGRLFDSSVARGETATFPLDRMIPGWIEGVQLMVVGEKTRFWIPSQMAYGDLPARPGAPAGMLVFDIELVDIQ